MKDDYFYTRAIRLNPQNAGRYYIERAKFYIIEKEYEKALKDYKNAVDLGENFDFEISLLYDLKEYVSADSNIKDLTQKIKLNPDKAFYYIARAKNYKLKKLYNKAFADISKAILLSPETEYYKKMDELCDEIKINNVKQAIKTAIQNGNKEIIFEAYKYQLELCKSKILQNIDYEYWKYIVLRKTFNEIYDLFEDKALVYYIFSDFYIKIKDIGNAIMYCKKAARKAKEQKNIVAEYLYNIQLISLYVNNNYYEKAMNVYETNVKKPSLKKIKQEMVYINNTIPFYVDVFEGNSKSVIRKEMFESRGWKWNIKKMKKQLDINKLQIF